MKQIRRQLCTESRPLSYPEAFQIYIIYTKLEKKAPGKGVNRVQAIESRRGKQFQLNC